MLTHCFTPYDNCVVGEDGKPRDEVVRAVERGVRLDVGHGTGSFSFPAAQAWARTGAEPVIISTDLHRRSVLGPAFDMCTVMTKMIAAGNPLEQVLRASTSSPAEVIGRVASLEVGAPADVAVLDLERGTRTLWDSRGVEVETGARLTCRLTVCRGVLEHVAPTLRVIGV